MSLLEQIRAARHAHEELRSSPPSRANVDLKGHLCRGVKELLDLAWELAARPELATSTADIRRAVGRLTDAEYFAGLGDAEGYGDPAEAWAAYGLLERAFADAC